VSSTSPRLCHRPNADLGAALQSRPEPDSASPLVRTQASVDITVDLYAESASRGGAANAMRNGRIGPPQADMAQSSTTNAFTLPLLLCFSHLRWDFVDQRPHHLLTRAARSFSVVFFEEYEVEEGGSPPYFRLRRTPEDILIAKPILSGSPSDAETDFTRRALINELLTEFAQPIAVAWYYTPLALAFTGDLRRL
jgi:hypothetical protein